MRKYIVALSLALAFVSVFALGVVGASSEFVIRFAHVYPLEDPLHVGAEAMAKRLAEASNGRLQLRTFPAGQLGGSWSELMELVQEGSIEMTMGGSSYLGTIMPQWGIVDAAFLFDDEDHAVDFWTSSLVSSWVDELIERRGFRVLPGVQVFGPRYLSTRNTPVKHPDDLKGLSIRVHEAQSRADMITAWGANVVTTPTAEMYLAMQTGLADGQESPANWQAINNYWEVQKYVMLTGHIIDIQFFAVGEAFYQRLPEDLQEIFLQEIIRAAAEVSKTYQEKNASAVDILRSRGMEVITAEEIDIAEFRRRSSEEQWKKWEPIWGEGITEKIRNRTY